MDRRMAAIHELRQAKQAHIRWVSYAYGLVEGLELNQDMVPVFETDCAFGKWYYGDGQLLSALPEYEAIEAPHRELHKKYARIVKLLFGENEKKGWFSRLIGKKSKIDDQRREHAMILYRELEAASQEVVKSLKALEQRLRDMTDTEFQTVAGVVPQQHTSGSPVVRRQGTTGN